MSHRNKIIYLSSEHFEQRDYERFGVKIIEQAGFQTEIWTVYSIIYKQELHQPKNIYTGKTNNITSIRNFIFELLRLLKTDGSCIFFMMTGFRESETFLRGILTMMGHRYCNFYINPYLNESSIGKGIDDIVFDKTRTLCDFLFPSLYNFTSTRKNYLVFPNKYSAQKKKNVLAHTLDYDIYLKNQRNQTEGTLCNKDYILFIDEAYTHHTDYEKLNMFNPTKGKEQTYYDELDRLFRKLEEIYQCPVVIATHPRAEYQKNEFHNRTLLSFQTEPLIRNSKLVVMHASGAVNFVLLHKKPFLCVYHSWTKTSYEWRYCYVPYMRYFSIQLFNASLTYTNEEILSYINEFDSSIRKKYIEEYIKCKSSKNKYFFEIVADTLKK